MSISVYKSNIEPYRRLNYQYQNLISEILDFRLQILDFRLQISNREDSESEETIRWVTYKTLKRKK